MTEAPTSDVRWGVAAAMADSLMEQLAVKLAELAGEVTRVVKGDKGLSVILFMSGTPDDAAVHELLVHATPLYLLDFDDEAPSTTRIERRSSGLAKSRLREHPADFLESKGIVLEEFVPEPAPISVVGLVEGVDPGQARRALPSSEIEFRSHPRGVLVIDKSGICTMLISKKLKKKAFVITRDQASGAFSCAVLEPGKPAAAFSPTMRMPEFVPLASIFGQVTLTDILRVLDIPSELLGFA